MSKFQSKKNGSLSLFIVISACIEKYSQYKFDGALWTLSLLIEILILALNEHIWLNSPSRHLI